MSTPARSATPNSAVEIRLPILNALREAEEEVREHHAAVAAGTENGALRGLVRHGRDGALPVATEVIRHRPHRHGEVGAGISVRNGKDIDAIELGALLLGVTHTRRSASDAAEGRPDTRSAWRWNVRIPRPKATVGLSRSRTPSYLAAFSALIRRHTRPTPANRVRQRTLWQLDGRRQRRQPRCSASRNSTAQRETSSRGRGKWWDEVGVTFRSDELARRIAEEALPGSVADLTSADHRALGAPPGGGRIPQAHAPAARVHGSGDHGRDGEPVQPGGAPGGGGAHGPDRALRGRPAGRR